jgi:MFS family permease
MLCLDGTRDGDLYLQLASGRFVAAHGFVAADPFQTIAHGEPWLNQQWLSELLVYRVVGWIGVTGLTVVYAGLLAAPLALMLWLCRRKGPAMAVALVALYCPGLLTIVHPRAAGFSVLAFSLLVAILALAWLRQRPQSPAMRLRWAVPATLALFAVWANLHGGFVAGLVLIGAVVCGLALERWLGRPNAVGSRRIFLLALTGALATGTAMLATPLGGALLSYLASFHDSAVSVASPEWRPAFQSPLAIAYLAVAAAFAAWLWARTDRPRALAPGLVVLVFLALALLALRNLVFVGPVLALAIASLAPDKGGGKPWSLVGLALVLSAGAAATWAVAIGPARNEPLLDEHLVGYALRHPPARGHIAAYAGIGSYMIWRAPRAPVELDGWLEHFTPAEVRGTYAVLDGRAADPAPYVRRLRIGAMIADRRVAIRALQADGFEVELADRAGAYLVRRTGAKARASGAALPSSEETVRSSPRTSPWNRFHQARPQTGRSHDDRRGPAATAYSARGAAGRPAACVAGC